MRQIFHSSAFALSLVLAWAVSSWPAAVAGDEKTAVTAVIERNVEGFRAFDADRVSTTYAEDADWTNAFGVRQHGRAKIRVYLNELFARPQFRSRAPSETPAELKVRFLRADVAVGHRFSEVIGQRGPNNEEMPPRKIHRLIVLTKDAGEWLIASEMVMDERQDRIVR